MLKYILSFIVFSTFLFANNFKNFSSLQGYMGVINTPTAFILDEAKIEFQYSNQVDAIRVRNNWDDYTAKHYFLTMGLLANFEVITRVTNIYYKNPPGEFEFLDRDVSVSMKYQLPFYHKYLPTVAIGIQDMVGIADRYSAKYFVATKEFDMIRASIGYGFDSKMLDGVFFSSEFMATDWVYLLFENDTKDNHVGLRLNLPKKISSFLDLSLLAKKNLSYNKQKPSFALNLKVDLKKEHKIPTINYSVKKVSKNIIYTPNMLKQKLMQLGFENIDIAEDKTTIYVAYENSIFEHNELDALGVVLGYMMYLDNYYENFEIVIKKSDLKVKRVTGSLKKYKEFINDFSSKSRLEFIDSLQVDTNFSNPKNYLIKDANSNYRKPKIKLALALKTFVATEISEFEYLLSLRPKIYWTLYKGVDFELMADIPFLHSKEFDPDSGAFWNFNEGSRVKDILLHKSDIFGNVINVLSLGMYDDQIGGFESIAYAKGDHVAKLKLGYLKDRFVDRKREIALASYSYYYPRYDVHLQLRTGKYYNQDSGFDIELKRFFDDISINFFYQKTADQYVGVGLEIPITPRKVPNGLIQLKGDSFYHQFRSTIRSPSGENIIKPGGAVDPKLSFEIEERFLNRKRLNISYLKNHLLRLREVYYKYVAL